ncbi:MAG: pyrroloquinoline quinone-dependent dehydrogenase [Myxococcota bacterium]|nr:pyrroloquinoline quinone-dependent dehydrogenase [Myxococcota bacterium]
MNGLLRAFLVCFGVSVLACGAPAPEPGGPLGGWPAYGGSEAATRYSPLTQIDPQNVDDLEIAWVYRSGDFDDGTGGAKMPSALQVTPILVDESLVFCTPFNRVISLDAETGQERWVHDPEVDHTGMYLVNCRGVSAWRDARAEPGAACATRIFTGTLDARLIALDATTGQPCRDFGDDGTVDLRGGVGDVRPGEYGVTSAPLVIGDRVVTGTMVLDNRRADMPGGVVRAFDARTGEQLWAWDPVPDDAPPPPAGVAYRRGTTNAWTTLSGDPELSLVFVPTGNTSPDYYGGHRDGLDEYSSSIVALDANTGDVAWSFQTVHHDVWDYDVAAQPVLFDFHRNGEVIPAVVQATKMGHLFFLDRRNGVPLFPVEELPVPQGPVDGESLSPTQPFPTRPPPIHPAELTPEDAWGPTPWDRWECEEKIASLRSEGIFTPPSLQGTVQFPGYVGGVNWGSLSIDEGRGILVVNSSQVAGLIRLIPRPEWNAMFPDGPPDFGFEPQAGTPYGVQRDVLMSGSGAPCNPPPWGKLFGIDVATGEIRWERPLGTSRDMAPFPVWLFLPEGVPNLGGPVTTASGLTFIGATTDHYLRAFDTETGEELWRGRLPTGAQATPMTYRLREDGPQWVVVAAGGHGLFGVPAGDSLVAFTLPER